MTNETITAQPSLLGLIVSEIEKMTESEKQGLLIHLRKEKLLAKAKALDAVEGVQKPGALTDEEADQFVSQQRKERYEQSKA